jgi:cytochrome P450
MSRSGTDDRVAAALAMLFDDAGRQDPYAAYRILRESGGVFYSPALSSYVVTTYPVCSAILADSSFPVPDAAWLDRQLPGWRGNGAVRFLYCSLLRQNPPGHTRVRRAVSRVFLPYSVSSLPGVVETVVDRALERLAVSGAGGTPVDFQGVVAFPVAIGVIGHLLGIPEHALTSLRQPTAEFCRALEPVLDYEGLACAAEGIGAIRTQLDAIVTRDRITSGDGLPSRLSAAGELSPEELTDVLMLLLIAGFTTTTALVGTGVDALLRHPAELARVRADPRLGEDAVAECLRWEAPVQFTERVTTRPVVLGGVPVNAGASLTVVIGAANRDPGAFPEPDRFVLGRTGAKALSFGGGVHHCLGATLARRTVSVLFGELFARFPGLVAAGPAVRRPTLTIREYDVLPVRITG